MAKIVKFEDLTVWQLGLDLSIEIYKILVNCKDFGLKDQICRCSVSVPSNIAEGFERGYNKDFIRFLKMAKGSSGEFRTQIYIALGVGVINKETAEIILNKSRHISSMLQKLIKTREENFN